MATLRERRTDAAPDIRDAVLLPSQPLGKDMGERHPSDRRYICSIKQNRVEDDPRRRSWRRRERGHDHSDGQQEGRPGIRGLSL